MVAGGRDLPSEETAAHGVLDARNGEDRLTERRFHTLLGSAGDRDDEAIPQRERNAAPRPLSEEPHPHEPYRQPWRVGVSKELGFEAGGSKNTAKRRLRVTAMVAKLAVEPTHCHWERWNKDHELSTATYEPGRTGQRSRVVGDVFEHVHGIRGGVLALGGSGEVDHPARHPFVVGEAVSERDDRVVGRLADCDARKSGPQEKLRLIAEAAPDLDGIVTEMREDERRDPAVVVPSALENLERSKLDVLALFRHGNVLSPGRRGVG